MLHIFTKALQTRLVTIAYPQESAQVSASFRGAPDFDFAAWKDALPAANACPTGAIEVQDSQGIRRVTVDYGRCIYCGECAHADGSGAVQTTRRFELAACQRGDLIQIAEYALDAQGLQGELIGCKSGDSARPDEIETLRSEVRKNISRLFGRSLAIREVDAGSCNGCEMEIGALNSPVYDLERLGMHFVASPRHADMLLVTGPVTRNMELALLKTYHATPAPKMVIAVGACGISGGIYGRNYATVGGVNAVLPVDVFIPGCPPRPHALLHGILLALGRMKQREFGGR
jgi:Ni,Fe-hydrogenase III small subunit/formate hydrogenlyase subunit 6/NADH:ubiquinone oxidoreductase subunit I